MMGHETLIKCTVAGSLGWDDNNERPIDRVTAIAFSTKNNEMGAAMLRVEALDAASLHKVILLLTRQLNHEYRVTRGFAEKMAVAALHEYLRPNCIHCGGKGEIHQKAGATVVCAECGGSGLHKYTDADRLALIGGAFNKPAYETAISQVRDALGTIIISANRRLKI